MSTPKAYTITVLDKDGNAVRHREFDPHNYPISKICAEMLSNLEPLYRGDVESILIQRVEHEPGS
jgi:hypothetical protein